MERIFDEPTDAKRAYREMHILRHLHHPAIVRLIDVVCPNILIFQQQKQLEMSSRQGMMSLDEQEQNEPSAPSPAKFIRTGSPSDYMDDTDSRTRAPISSARIEQFGTLYLIFEFVDTDLQKIIRSNQYLQMEHIQYIMYQILDGLRYIHMSNVIHRDLKPANVLISCADTTVKIADFGLSRVVGADLVVQWHGDTSPPQKTKIVGGSGGGGDEYNVSEVDSFLANNMTESALDKQQQQQQQQTKLQSDDSLPSNIGTPVPEPTQAGMPPAPPPRPIDVTSRNQMQSPIPTSTVHISSSTLVWLYTSYNLYHMSYTLTLYPIPNTPTPRCYYIIIVTTFDNTCSTI